MLTVDSLAEADIKPEPAAIPDPGPFLHYNVLMTAMECEVDLPLKKQIEIDDWKNEYLPSKSGRAPIIGETVPKWVVEEQEAILGLYQATD